MLISFGLQVFVWQIFSAQSSVPVMETLATPAPSTRPVWDSFTAPTLSERQPVEPVEESARKSRPFFAPTFFSRAPLGSLARWNIFQGWSEPPCDLNTCHANREARENTDHLVRRVDSISYCQDPFLAGNPDPIAQANAFNANCASSERLACVDFAGAVLTGDHVQPTVTPPLRNVAHALLSWVHVSLILSLVLWVRPARAECAWPLLRPLVELD